MPTASCHASFKALQDTLASNARRLRADRGLTQEQAAHACAMSTRLLQRIEAAAVNTTLISVARLCSGYGVDAAELFQGLPPDIEMPEGSVAGS